MLKKDLIQVTLIKEENVTPIDMASHAALECYDPKPPALGQKIDVEGALFKTGHHTTLQHTYFTFNIEGISVGDITFGLHLNSPFYNSDQRSGRFCSAMFENPDFEALEGYLKTFWFQNSDNKNQEEIKYKCLKLLRMCLDTYQDNLPEAISVADKLLRKERPKASEKYYRINSKKIAQEQLRMLIPVVFPTGLDYSVNLTALAALQRSAWSPVMKYVVQEMCDIVVAKYPEIEFIFDHDINQNEDWAPEFQLYKRMPLMDTPEVRNVKVFNPEMFVPIDDSDKHPLDLLHFKPKYMDNDLVRIESDITVSVATMGQDQRHRTLRRSKPKFTGGFYVPQILSECGLKEKAEEIFKYWVDLAYSIEHMPMGLWAIMAPYGAMVEYKKIGSINAIAHEQAKRLCWCAQEEIYNLSRMLREVIATKPECYYIAKIFEPHCFKTGNCAEGSRYCGRDRSVRSEQAYSPRRMV